MLLYAKNKINKVFLSIISSIIIIGLLTLYSATTFFDGSLHWFFYKQIIGLSFAIIVSSIFILIPYHFTVNWGAFAHVGVIGLLFLTLINGSTVMGGKRWISLLGITFQPSELSKITLPACIVTILSRYGMEKIDFKGWFLSIAIILLTVILITKQPDLGSGIIVGISGIFLLFFAGLPKKIIFIALFFLSLGLPLIWKFSLHEYQRKRLIVFLGGGTQKRERYQVDQAMIAIGSGGFWGRGFLQGIQKNLHFIPECHNDFIFSVFCEEFGFCGVITLFLLYISLFLYLFIVSMRIDDFYSYLLFIGLILPFFCSILCNLAMVVGLLPTVGIPLPMISAGLSNLITTLLSLSIVQNIIMHCE